MYQKILVPLTARRAAEHALPTALSLARRFGAAILGRSRTRNQFGAFMAKANGMTQQQIGSCKESWQSYLDGVKERLLNVAEVPVTSVLLAGPGHGRDQPSCCGYGADLVVMTTQGRVRRPDFGWEAWPMLWSDKCRFQCCLCDHRKRKRTSPKSPFSVRVLIPLDGSQLAEQIVEPAVALTAATRAEVTLLRVIQQLTPESYSPDSGRRSGLRPALLNQLKEIDSAGTDSCGRISSSTRGAIAGSFVERADSRGIALRPATAILEEASTDNSNIIAMATHGRGGLKRLLVGSVADKVLRGATRPLLVYRPVGEVASAEGE